MTKHMYQNSNSLATNTNNRFFIVHSLCSIDIVHDRMTPESYYIACAYHALKHEFQFHEYI